MCASTTVATTPLLLLLLLLHVQLLQPRVQLLLQLLCGMLCVLRPRRHAVLCMLCPWTTRHSVGSVVLASPVLRVDGTHGCEELVIVQ
jgi:hypothetical protein